MPDYAIGDVQGCYDSLLRLLDHIHFDDKIDRLWFVGDLVCRGPNSLAVLRFIRKLPIPPKISLGNHDLALLRLLFCPYLKESHHESLEEILKADDAQELGHWLRHQGLLHYDESLNIVMVHAGIPPVWDLKQALIYAQELDSVLRSNLYSHYLLNCFGNKPACWSEKLPETDRWRLITNYLTRMRFCNSEGCLFLEFKGAVVDAPRSHIPWYAAPSRKPIEPSIIFGHWAALKNVFPGKGLYAIDTGCVWGGDLTALRLQDKQLFKVPG